MPFGGALTAGAIAAPILGGIIGNMASSGDRQAAMDAIARAQSIINQVPDAPDLSKIKIIYDQFKQAGVLTPELENAIQQSASAVSQIQEDPTLRSAQTQALQLIQQRGTAGLTPTDRATLAQLQQQVQQQVEAKQQQIVQNLQQRGMAGSGAELAAQLQASQSGAQQASQQGLQVAAQASQNALQALAQSGQLGGQIRAQDFGVAQTKAQAADEVARFNIQNALSQQQRNVASQNQAQAANLAQAQAAMNANIQNINQEKLRQVEAVRQHWQDQFSLAQAKANAAMGAAGPLMGAAQQTAQMWSGMGSGVGAGLGGLSNYFSNQALLDKIGQIGQKQYPNVTVQSAQQYPAAVYSGDMPTGSTGH